MLSKPNTVDAVNRSPQQTLIDDVFQNIALSCVNSEVFACFVQLDCQIGVLSAGGAFPPDAAWLSEMRGASPHVLYNSRTI